MIEKYTISKIGYLTENFGLKIKRRLKKACDFAIMKQIIINASNQKSKENLSKQNQKSKQINQS